jgi:hypothetical protein
MSMKISNDTIGNRTRDHPAGAFHETLRILERSNAAANRLIFIVLIRAI